MPASWDEDMDVEEFCVSGEPGPEVECSDLHADEAYLPQEPGPEVERYWPVSTRAIAIEFARQARLRGRGAAAIDDATLERVADAIMDPANPPPWQPLTAEERRDRMPEGLWDAVHGYLIDHPDVDAYVDVLPRDGRTTFTVGIVGDTRPHQAALEAIGGDRIVVEPWAGPPPHTDDELWAIADRIAADRAELATAGWHVEDVVRSTRGGLEVGVVGLPDERTAAEFFSARYGTAVSVRWLGPNRFLERLHPFGSWESDGCRLRVHLALDPNGEELGPIRLADEDEARIVVALSSFEPVALTRTLIGGFGREHADVELRQPVGNRVVIDASAGVARPCVTQLRRR